MIGQIFLALAILITIHELGHFLAARLFKIRVDKFYLFFDFLFPMPEVMKFSIFKKKIGATEYGLGWFPMGGYVQIAGMVDEQMDKDALDKPVEPDEYRAKPAWQRLIVLMGGIIFNIILGIIIFTGIKFVWGESYLPAKTVNQKTGLYASAKMEALGFKTGDKVLKINGKDLVDYTDLFTTDFMLADKKEVTAMRNGNLVTFDPGAEVANIIAGNRDEVQLDIINRVKVDSVAQNSAASAAGLKKDDILISMGNTTLHSQKIFLKTVPSYKENSTTLTFKRGNDTLSAPVKIAKDGLLGVFTSTYDFTEVDFIDEQFGFGQSVSKGTGAAFAALVGSVKGLGAVFSGKVDASKSVSGPIGIARMFGKQWNWLKFWTLTGLLSMALAFFNILPIPGLDGGHGVFVLYEMVTRRKPNEKFLYAMQVVGTIIILGLMVLIFGLDIWNLIRGN